MLEEQGKRDFFINYFRNYRNGLDHHLFHTTNLPAMRPCVAIAKWDASIMGKLVTHLLGPPSLGEREN